jgi:predicted metal-dependent peptidase
MIGEKGIKDDCPTAYTNGRDDYYGRAFADGLSDSEFRFLILHETYHKLFKHLTTWEHLYKDDAKLANMACDYVINLMIYDENRDGFATMPKDAEGNNIGLLDEKFRNMSAAQVYKILKQEQEDNPDDGDQGEGAGAGLDEHDWEGAQEMSADEQRELAQEIDQAIRQGALTAGKVGSGGNRAIDQLLQPEVNWRGEMDEFITETCRGNDDSTWRQLSRRHMAMGILRPSGITERVGELVIAIDTSGSIGQHELTKCLSEIKGVCDTVKPESVRILYWDTKVCSDELYGDVPNACASLEQLTQTTKPQGGGGTNVQCVPDYIRDNNINAQAVIVLTDGYLGGDWGTWTMPLLWGILDNKSAKPTTGKTLHINL